MFFDDTSDMLSIVRAGFITADTLTWEELFDGFNCLWAITYSSSMDFVCKLLKKFDYVEIIFGFEEIIASGIEKIFAYQSVSREFIKEISGKNKTDLVSRIDKGTLHLFVAREQLSHEKTYILEAADGRKRVVIGSANLSNAAFSGKQRENICYFDDDAAFDYYFTQFNKLKANSADNITKKCLTADVSRIDTLPLAETVLVKNAVIIKPTSIQDDSVRFVIDVKESVKKYAEIVSKNEKSDKQGFIRLIPENIKRMQKQFSDKITQEKELKKEYPELIIDIKAQIASLNGKPLDFFPKKDDVLNDVLLFLKYMSGFDTFYGDVSLVKARYFELANWFFASPFMACLRTTALVNRRDTLPYPIFALLYGKSNAGKSRFLELLLKMMIGQFVTPVKNNEFTKTAINALRYTVKGVPIVVDDISRDRFVNHIVETVKSDYFGADEQLINYPAIVISANEDVKVVEPELVKRMAVFRVNIGLDNNKARESANAVLKAQKDIGMAFYCEYLRHMMPIVSDILDTLRYDDEIEFSPDILAMSSEVLTTIIRENTEETPEFVRNLSFSDYFGSKIIADVAIKKIKDAWKRDRKAFLIDKKADELQYNAMDYHEAVRIVKELPAELESRYVRDSVIMRLSKARKFFEIDFKNRLFM
ncbi:MAG: phospholipase D family protein [Treponema sp.]|jgi:hypothetical protein|nr:phospholipase D family protein [Treponema sp.]